MIRSAKKARKGKGSKDLPSIITLRRVFTFLILFRSFADEQNGSLAIDCKLSSGAANKPAVKQHFPVGNFQSLVL
jgi:hypothetical protein